MVLTAHGLNARLPYCFDDEIDYFKSVGKELPEGSRVVILGLGPGIMALALLEGAGDKLLDVVGIDCCNVTGIEHLKAAGKDIRFIQAYTNSCADMLPDKSVDFLVVDADHSFVAVSEDIKNWLPKVKIGGKIFFHDYIPHERDAVGNGVRRAVNLARLSYPLEDEAFPGISVVLRKN